MSNPRMIYIIYSNKNFRKKIFQIFSVDKITLITYK